MSDPTAPRITRAEFILLTVGAELRRAGTYLHHDQVLHDFTDALPELEGDGRIDEVVLRWWTPDDHFAGGCSMKLTPPGAFAGPGFEGGDYVAECKLPTSPGHRLQVAVHLYGAPTGLAVQGDPWERGNRAALDSATGTVLFEGRYMPAADVVIRLVTTERNRAELMRARRLEAAHGRAEVVAAIDARLSEPLPERPQPRRLGLGLGLLPLLCAMAWAPQHDPPRCPVCKGRGFVPTDPHRPPPPVAASHVCPACGGGGREHGGS